MKKKGLLMLMAATALTTVGLTSCSSEMEATGNANEAAMTRSVTFNISLPSGDPVQYKTRTPLQIDNEFKFNNLKMLVYDAKDEKLLSVESITLPDPLSGSTNPTEATIAANGLDYQYTYTTPVMANGTLARRFVFVANDDCSDTNLATDKLYTDDLPNAKAKATIVTGGESSVFTDGFLPMHGEAKTNGSYIINMDQNSDVPVNVDLTRGVARIDVHNNVANLTITDLKLINANPNGFLKQKLSSGNVVIPSAMTKVDDVEPFSALTTAINTETAGGDFVPAEANYTGSPKALTTPAILKKAFYVYEDEADATKVLTLLVQGKLDNKIAVYYTIPFVNENVEGWTGDAADKTKGIEILRNHLYKVVIGDGQKVGINTKMTTRLLVADWEANTNVEGTFYANLFNGVTNSLTGVTYNKVTQHFEIPAAALAAGDGVSIDVSDTYWDGGNGVKIQKVQVITDGAWTAESTTTATDGWLTAEISTNADATQPDAAGKRVTISAAANTDPGAVARNGAIRLIYINKSGDLSTVNIAFTIKQDA